MKKIFSLMAVVVLAAAVFTSCKKADDETPAPEGVNCTVLVYGSAGNGEKNLDFTYVAGLIKSLKTVQPGKINIVSEYNFDPSAQNYANLKGTKRLALVKNDSSIEWNVPKTDTAGKTSKEKEAYFNKKMNDILGQAITAGDIVSESVNDKPIKLYDVNNIKAFIDWAADKYPAERYIFVISGHGGAWSAADDCEKSATKAAAWDNNNDTLAVSAKELVAGINASTAASKVQAILTDACNMNVMENVTEYAATAAKYSIVSFQYSYGIDYDILLQELGKQDNSIDGLGYALLSYSKNNVDSDWTLWDLTKVAAVNAEMKTAVGLFKTAYNSDDSTYYNGIINNLKTDTASVKDGSRRSIHDFWYQMSTQAKTDELKDQSKKVVESIESASKTFFGKNTDYNKFNQGDHISAQALFLGKSMYAKECGKNDEYKASFTNNAFYKKTGWNEMFSLFSDSINPKPKK